MHMLSVMYVDHTALQRRLSDWDVLCCAVLCCAVLCLLVHTRRTRRTIVGRKALGSFMHYHTKVTGLLTLLLTLHSRLHTMVYTHARESPVSLTVSVPRPWLRITDDTYVWWCMAYMWCVAHTSRPRHLRRRRWVSAWYGMHVMSVTTRFVAHDMR
jgi:hypothetical protein